jgi:hypothetical protein
VRTQLALSHVDATPGLTSRIEIEVTNTSTVIEGVTAIVDGINPEWVRRAVVRRGGLLLAAWQSKTFWRKEFHGSVATRRGAVQRRWSVEE